ncbi:peptidoglycan-binding domain-containing protein [Aristaeella hokkaidonensis]|uniref:Peptidoglycan-binding protein n=1 Tax=Aristaeella hokkaidonensis TaxID=3046382 RepID=A0AC61N7Q7_9FIRM|nr:peptidoglycan-binding protein [Aristaeella hokkaidonensis]QUC67564.1 peptidoglycan-binding protein [Aristaeella hokkaidonensis]SNT92606.1 Peptidoglycan-binding (PGRP) domain of peptidoglycan hydrolases-containing protein [Aristaeella hokkaidonensis]
MMKKQLLSLFLIFVLLLSVCTVSYAVKPATLSLNSTGDNVKSLQKSLISLGYLKGKADGVFGSKTEEAVKKFQKANDLTVDGLAGADTQGAINAVLKKKNNASTSKQVTPKTTEKLPAVLKSILPEIATGGRDPVFGGDYSTLCNGSVGNRVKTVQTILIAMGYLGGSADGIYGTNTENAVRKYQEASGMSSTDGIAGPLTLANLYLYATSPESGLSQYK